VGLSRMPTARMRRVNTTARMRHVNTTPKALSLSRTIYFGVLFQGKASRRVLDRMSKNVPPQYPAPMQQDWRPAHDHAKNVYLRVRHDFAPLRRDLAPPTNHPSRSLYALYGENTAAFVSAGPWPAVMVWRALRARGRSRAPASIALSRRRRRTRAPVARGTGRLLALFLLGYLDNFLTGPRPSPARDL
jgi:hypothetical protein